MKVLLLSDTHNYLDETILKHCREADEIWHAGDFGTAKISDSLNAVKPLRGVYGNIDGQELRKMHPELLFFTVENVTVLMMHIGGYPGSWSRNTEELITRYQPHVFICGHSHILKIMRDPKHKNMLCINPGAAGKSGFHQMRTMVRMTIEKGKVNLLEVIEMGRKE
ncbi:MAG: metallophosphatase family protein [Bacteroidota bacterium]|nr:metallophosphatase family protein [Bacteroidota bacterium]